MCVCVGGMCVWYVCVVCVCGVCALCMVCVHGVCGVCVCGGVYVWCVCVVCVYEFVCGASSVTHTHTQTNIAQEIHVAASLIDASSAATFHSPFCKGASPKTSHLQVEEWLGDREEAKKK